MTTKYKTMIIISMCFEHGKLKYIQIWKTYSADNLLCYQFIRDTFDYTFSSTTVLTPFNKAVTFCWPGAGNSLWAVMFSNIFKSQSIISTITPAQIKLYWITIKHNLTFLLWIMIILYNFFANIQQVQFAYISHRQFRCKGY